MSNLELIVDKIKRDKGLDLSGYKDSTLTRRIERRMRFDGAKSLEEYIRMIDRDYHLYWHLISDFFIGVTDFFRDKEIYDLVQSEILPQIIARHCEPRRGEAISDKEIASSPSAPRNDNTLQGPIRIWSAGCSTGEETYSLAMMIREIYERRGIKGLPAFVHGTDILEDKLEIAKRGVYSQEKVEKVEGRLREKYFEPPGVTHKRNTHHAIRNTIKIMTRFKKIDLVHPIEFLGFDMIVCRNVLIYFQRKLQEKVIKHFYKALRPNGILWLGKSETLWRKSEPLFEPIYKNEKIFKKI